MHMSLKPATEALRFGCVRALSMILSFWLSVTSSRTGSDVDKKITPAKHIRLQSIVNLWQVGTDEGTHTLRGYYCTFRIQKWYFEAIILCFLP